jgi:hypothetical protein
MDSRLSSSRANGLRVNSNLTSRRSAERGNAFTGYSTRLSSVVEQNHGHIVVNPTAKVVVPPLAQ